MQTSINTFKTEQGVKALLLKDLDDNQLTCIEPYVKPVTVADQQMYVCRHSPSNMHRLVQAGLNPPMLDVGHDFHHIDPDWVYYDHQKTTAGFLAMWHRAWCLNGMRSGKTLSAIIARELLRSLGYKGRTVILSPENIVNDSWGDEYKWVAPELNIYVADKSVDHLHKHGFRDDNDILIINHGKLPYIVVDLDEFGFDYLIVDESSLYRTPDKEPARNIEFLCMNRGEGHKYPSMTVENRWVWALTGSPRPSSAADTWVMGRIINRKLMSMPFNHWRKKVQKHHDVKDKNGKFIFRDWRDRSEVDVEKICALYMKPSICFRTKDCVNLPPQSYKFYHTPCDGKQKQLYNMIGKKKAGIVQNDDGTKDAFRAMTTPNVFNKLMQVASGTVVNTDDQWIEIGCPKRMKALLELYEQAEGKVVVFCTYVATAAYIKEQLRKKKIKCDVINGTVPKARREKIRKEFQSRKKRSVLVLHPEVTRFGTNVSAATVTIWWTPPAHPEYWTQGNERARRPGTGNTLVAMFYSTQYERKYYDRVRTKHKANERTTGFFAEFKKVRVNPDVNLANDFLQNWGNPSS